MIRSILISGFLDEDSMAQVLGEILDIGAAEPDCKLVLVFDSEGGSSSASMDFMDCVLNDEPTRALLEKADVKIYEAHSAAALIAFWIGKHREMARGTKVGFHLPNIKLGYTEVGFDGKLLNQRIVKLCQDNEAMLAQLLNRYGLEEPELKAQLYSSGWLYLTAEECLSRGLVHGLF